MKFKMLSATCLVLLFSVTICLAQQHGRLIVTLIPGLPAADRPAVAKAHGLEMIHDLPIINGMVVRSASPEQAKGALKKDKRIARVEEDAVVTALKKPADKPGTPGGGDEDPPPQEIPIPWGVKRIGADLAWPYSTGAGIRVAILDTGIDNTHPDLAQNHKGGVNIINVRKSPKDDNGHGTWCAGIVAAVNNGFGVVGVAPAAWLYAVKVLDRQGSGYTSDVIAGIQWCVANGMDIASMSLGSNSDIQALHDACDVAHDAGLVLVAAAGNDGDGNGSTDEVDYPGAYDSVCAVGATDANDAHPKWSSDGNTVEVSAPGVDIISTYKDGEYGIGSGTSAACPHVSGVVALVLSRFPNMKPSEVRTLLADTAAEADLDNTPGWDVFYGYGLVYAPDAVAGPQQ